MIIEILKSKTFAVFFFLLIWTTAIICLKNNFELLVYPVITIGLIYEILTSNEVKKVFLLLCILGFLGWVLQSLEAYLGTLIIYQHTPFAPPWLALLWGLFMSSTLRTMSFAFKNITTSFLFGCYALPGTYYFISKLGLAEIKEPIWKSLALDSLLSGFIFSITYLLLKFSFNKKGLLYVQH